jgi:pimeloyl-ACP methyl ester carboxylesterase
MAWLEWGEPGAANTLVCVHGLTRCARDFDTLAAEMARRGFRVVCPDAAGRGDSEWLADPPSIPCRRTSYMQTLIVTSRLWCWVGTSLGGMIGMMPRRCPIRR